MIVEVYDIEVLSNLFTYTGYDRVSDKWFQFVIHSSCNQYNELMQHLNRDKNIVQVGFNNVNYDYPVLHHLFNHYNEYRDMGGKELAQRIYEKSQQIIEAEFSAVAAKNQYITQIDVFKINHWDNKARHCSLKHCEVAMRMDSVEDMPLHHTHWVTKQEEINMILSYNKHDVKATNMVFDYCLGKVDHPVYRGKNKVALRQTLSKKYKMNLLNHSDVKMGEDLLLHTYCKTIGVPEYLVKKSGTPRKVMHLKDCIPSYINFKTPQFRKLHDKWLHLSIHSTKGAISDSIIFQGIKLDYGTGGIHGSNTGIFEANEDWVIIDSDVGSLYPSIAVQNGYYPEHLGIVFKEIYEDLVVTRLNEKEKPKKERDMVIMEGYKLFVNGAYGKSNEESSFIYDPLYTMKTTITGQLSLTMLIERLTLHIPDIQWIQANTDGITARVPRKDAEVYYKICSMWEKVTKLVLEHAQYSKMIVRDVSNYIAVYENGDTKLKGVFEIFQELHKNPSTRIIPIALKEYFVNNIPVEQTIQNHTDIYDFCLMLKINRGWKGVYRYLKDGDLKSLDLGRITRYYISGSTGIICKENVNDGRVSGVNVGFGVQVFNKYVEKPMKDYDINYQYYISECYKIINSVEDRQLSLF